jgi:hypothetical protein
MIENDWWDLIDKDPADADLWLAFACWLQDEMDDPVGAEAVRWIVGTRRRVFAQEYPPNNWSWCGPAAEAFDHNSFRSYRSYLPPELFSELTGQRWVSSGVGYETRRAGDEDLIAAFRKAVAAGWQPETYESVP